MGRNGKTRRPSSPMHRWFLPVGVYAPICQLSPASFLGMRLVADFPSAAFLGDLMTQWLLVTDT